MGMLTVAGVVCDEAAKPSGQAPVKPGDAENDVPFAFTGGSYLTLGL